MERGMTLRTEGSQSRQEEKKKKKKKKKGSNQEGGGEGSQADGEIRPRLGQQMERYLMRLERVVVDSFVLGRE